MQAAEQAEHNLGLANGRVPPAWSVENDRKYTLRNYSIDLAMWAAATDIDAARRGPAAALRITGAARLVLREMPIAQLSLGITIVDGNGNNVQLSGLETMVRVLERRYGELDQETQVYAVSELMTFHRNAHETG